jgi:hypothetical protein
VQCTAKIDLVNSRRQYFQHVVFRIEIILIDRFEITRISGCRRIETGTNDCLRDGIGRRPESNLDGGPILITQCGVVSVFQVEGQSERPVSQEIGANGSVEIHGGVVFHGG